MTAEPLLLEAVSNASRRWRERNPHTQLMARVMARAIVALYEAWGEPEKARQYRERLDQTGGSP